MLLPAPPQRQHGVPGLTRVRSWDLCSDLPGLWHKMTEGEGNGLPESQAESSMRVCLQCVLASGPEEDMDSTGDECKYFSSALFIESVQLCDVK